MFSPVLLKRARLWQFSTFMLWNEVERSGTIRYSIWQLESGICRMEVRQDSVEENLVSLPDEQIDAPDRLGFPGIKQREEGVVDFMVLKCPTAVATISTV